VHCPQVAKTAFPKFKPMLVPPAPWRSANTGAHLTMRSFVMRMGEQQANRRLLEAADREMAEGKLGASQVRGWCNLQWIFMALSLDSLPLPDRVPSALQVIII
jgi:DNA-directed RNA polymerase N-terminal